MIKPMSVITLLFKTLAAEHATLLLRAAILTITLFIAGCSGSEPNDEGGIIGTGKFKGTASSPNALANNAIKVKAGSGENFRVTLSAGNRFATESAAGTGPWVLQATLTSGTSLYGIAFGDGSSNINSYSDVILRNWFAVRAIDLDSTFDSNNRFDTLPTQAEFNIIAEQLFAIVDLVFLSYNIEAQQVLTGDFAADDQGIDNFLDNNPALINNGIVNLLLTDPTSGTQSQTRSDLELNADFGQLDNTPPSAPTSVRAIGSLLDELVLIWEPAVDDTAVQGYQIWRDGSPIATTPYPVYSDTDLETGRQYTYSIFAFDAAGNRSPGSSDVIGETLGSIDTQAPQAPTRLSLLGNTNNRIELIWGQSNVADVVAFNLYRGTTPNNLQLLVKTTSTIALDTTVTNGQTFCYQVSALDASDNESPFSEVLCVRAGGSVTDNTNSDILLNLPDIDALTCDQNLQQSDVEQNRTLMAGCYVVAESITLAPFTKLTLSEGVTLKFGAGVKLVISQNAALTADGTATSPVILTGLLSAPGYWDGIQFNRTNNTANLLRHTLIQFAGGGELEGAVQINASVAERTRLRIENSVIRLNDNFGILGQSQGILLESFQNNRITQNRVSASFNLNLLNAISGSSNFSGNDTDWIDVPRNNLSVPVVIANPGIPIRSGGMLINNAPLTIEAGVEMIILPNSVFDVSGTLSFQGTADSPILLTGLDSSAGSWQGLLLSGAGNNTINHTQIQHAGINSPQGGAIQLNCTQANPVTLTIDNTDITDSASWGIFQDSADCTVDSGGNVTFVNVAMGPVNTP